MAKPVAKAIEQNGSLRFCITLPMANSQMLTSKMPIHMANTFCRWDRKMMRTVEMVTTHTSAKKIRTGNQERLTARPPELNCRHRPKQTAAPDWKGRGYRLNKWR